ncbi:MAG: hypothetical protein SFU86_25060 [Pirellulaceae bacterium]|nr:hypothetical protein [Pirellulaceae bacterium]
MRACLLAAAAALLLATGTGCHGINLAKGNCNHCGGVNLAAGNCAHGGHCAACNHAGKRRLGHGQAYAEAEIAGYDYYAAHGGHGGGHGGGYQGPPHLGTRGTPGFHHHPHSRSYVGPPGPSTAQVAYPYYTNRGPRDFLIDNPPSIGR